jgi:hypothetical protein
LPKLILAHTRITACKTEVFQLRHTSGLCGSSSR